MPDKGVLSNMTTKSIYVTVIVGCLTLSACSGGSSDTTNTELAPTASTTNPGVGSATTIDDPLAGSLADPTARDDTETVAEIPEVTEVPEVPEVAEVAEVPDVSEVTEITEVAKVTEVTDAAEIPEITKAPEAFDPLSTTAKYHLLLENYWGVENYPQEFPEDAHLSLIGGATHNEAVSFWDVGEVASRGIEDMAEAGLIDKLLLDEVDPAIENGTADSRIEIREYTDAEIEGVPGITEFDLSMNSQWPRVSMVTMLGPSPDWFVGVSGLALQDADGWLEKLSVDLPLYDGGTKSDITPVMGGPDIRPPNPIGLVAYEQSQGVYLPTNTPQIVGRLIFERIE